MGQTLDPGATLAAVLERAQQVVGERADMALRAARSDDQPIGDRALVLEVDKDDVLGLVFVQAAENEIFEGGAVPLLLVGGFGRA
jgi:hypothetical protein